MNIGIISMRNKFYRLHRFFTPTSTLLLVATLIGCSPILGPQDNDYLCTLSMTFDEFQGRKHYHYDPLTCNRYADEDHEVFDAVKNLSYEEVVAPASMHVDIEINNASFKPTRTIEIDLEHGLIASCWNDYDISLFSTCGRKVFRTNSPLTEAGRIYDAIKASNEEAYAEEWDMEKNRSIMQFAHSTNITFTYGEKQWSWWGDEEKMWALRYQIVNAEAIQEGPVLFAKDIRQIPYFDMPILYQFKDGGVYEDGITRGMALSFVAEDEAWLSAWTERRYRIEQEGYTDIEIHNFRSFRKLVFEKDSATAIKEAALALEG